MARRFGRFLVRHHKVREGVAALKAGRMSAQASWFGRYMSSLKVARLQTDRPLVAIGAAGQLTYNLCAVSALPRMEIGPPFLVGKDGGKGLNISFNAKRVNPVSLLECMQHSFCAEAGPMTLNLSHLVWKTSGHLDNDGRGEVVFDRFKVKVREFNKCMHCLEEDLQAMPTSAALRGGSGDSAERGAAHYEGRRFCCRPNDSPSALVSAGRRAAKAQGGQMSVPNQGSSNRPSYLNVIRLPGRLDADRTAEVLGFQAHDIPGLVNAGLLRPLGGGPKNTVKYFAAVDVEAHSRDVRWLDKATRAVRRLRQHAESG